MNVSMENCYIWVLTLDKIKLNDSQYGDYYFSSDTGQDKTEWQSVSRITDTGEKFPICMENYYFSPDTGRDKKEW